MQNVVGRQELSRLTGLSIWTIWRLSKEKKIPHLRIGRRMLYRLDSIQEWLAKIEAESIVESPSKEGEQYGTLRRV